MDSARLNMYWFLWIATPALIMLSATYVDGRRVIIMAIITSLCLTYVLSNLAVIEKWDQRIEEAGTEEQLEAATADGANKVFTLYVFAPIEAAFFTGLWYWVGRRIWNRSTPYDSPDEE